MHTLPSKLITWANTDQDDESVLVGSVLKALGKMLRVTAARSARGLSDVRQKSKAATNQYPRANRLVRTMMYAAKKSMDRPSSCSRCRSAGASCQLAVQGAAVSMQSRWREAKYDGMLARTSPTDTIDRERHRSRTITSRYPCKRVSVKLRETAGWVFSAEASIWLMTTLLVLPEDSARE